MGVFVVVVVIATQTKQDAFPLGHPRSTWVPVISLISSSYVSDFGHVLKSDFFINEI